MTETFPAVSETTDKRRLILEQAIHVFAEQGFRDADVQVIADRAGVGKGTVYRYFGSKKELFWASTFDVLLRLERRVFEAMEHVDGIGNKLRAAARAYTSFFIENPQYLEVFIQDRAEFRGDVPETHREYHRKLIERVEELLQEAVETGELRPVDTRKVTLAFGSLLYGTVVIGTHLSPLPPLEMTEYSVEILLRGICAEQS